MGGRHSSRAPVRVIPKVPPGWFRVFSALLDVGVVVLNGDWEVDYASPRACDQLGCDEEEVPTRFAPVAKDLKAAMANWDHPDDPVAECFVSVKVGKTDRVLRSQIHTLDEPECTGHLVVLQEKAAAERIDTSLRILARYTTLRSVYQATAHDLKGGLQAVLLNLEVIKHAGLEYENLVQRRRALNRYGRVVEREVERIRKSLAYLLEQAEAGPAEPSVFDLRDVLRAVVDVVRPRAAAQRTTFTHRLPRRNTLIRGFPDRLTQAFVNLGTNALEAMGEGGELELATLPSRRDGRVRIEVCDTGPGVPDPLRASIWRLHYSTKPHGSGIGLHVTRSIVREHGGIVFLRAAGERRGACFEMWLPRHASAR